MIEYYNQYLQSSIKIDVFICRDVRDMKFLFILQFNFFDLLIYKNKIDGYRNILKVDLERMWIIYQSNVFYNNDIIFDAFNNNLNLTNKYYIIIIENYII